MIRRNAVHFLTICLLALLTACAGPRSRHVEHVKQVEHAAPETSIPLDIGKLKIAKSFQFPNPQLGTLYTYAGNMELHPDVYIYANTFVEGQPSYEVQVQTLEWEVARFKNEIDYVVMQGHYDSAEIRSTTVVTHEWKYGAITGKRISLDIVKNENVLLSHTYIFPMGDLFMKIRISHYDYPGLVDNMDWFVEQLIQGIRVAHYEDDGSPVINIGDGDVKQQLLSRLDDIFVVKARKEAMEKAVIETRDGAVYYGEFDKKEPVKGPAETGMLQNDGRDSE